MLVSILLLSLQDLTTFILAHVAHVARLSKSEVVVEAPLAAPVTSSLGWLLDTWNLRWGNLLNGLPLGVLVVH